MSFRDKAARDIGRCFMRLDHFGETHYWNGCPIVCVPDEEEALKKKGLMSVDVSWDADRRQILIHVPCEDFPGGKDPEPNTQIMFDKRPMVIVNVSHNIGVWDILLGAVEPREF